jgi:hypothetical protein
MMNSKKSSIAPCITMMYWSNNSSTRPLPKNEPIKSSSSLKVFAILRNWQTSMTKWCTVSWTSSSPLSTTLARSKVLSVCSLKLSATSSLTKKSSTKCSLNRHQLRRNRRSTTKMATRLLMKTTSQRSQRAMMMTASPKFRHSSPKTTSGR